MNCLRLLVLLWFFLLQPLPSQARQAEKQGDHFAKKAYIPRPIPRFQESKELLPHPIYDDNPLWVAAYWKTWELAFNNFHAPAEGTGFVSQFIDAAFNDNIFFWDTAFMTMFLNTAHPLVPGISSLDNFYAKQHPTGEICREINRSTGIDFEPWRNTRRLPLFSRWGFNVPDTANANVFYHGREAPSPNPHLTLDALNHPVAAWAEWESFLWTADTARLALVRQPLARYYNALRTYLRQGNGLFLTDWASMDNSPRNPFLRAGGTGVDISSEMVLFGRNLADIAEVLGDTSAARQFTREAESLAILINEKMWDSSRHFYFDRTADEHLCPVKTIAAYWTLLSRTASPSHAASLASELQNPATFGRPHPVPTLAADERTFFPGGGYWSGAVWIATNTMVLKGLEMYGYHDLARDIAMRHIDAMARVFERTGTIWENYAADSIKEGSHTDGKPVARDFVGFSGVTPILHFLEYGIGLKPDAPRNQLTWNLRAEKRSGCGKFRFNGHVVDLLAEPTRTGMHITIRSDGEFKLNLIRNGKMAGIFVVPGIASVDI